MSRTSAVAARTQAVSPAFTADTGTNCTAADVSVACATGSWAQAMRSTPRPRAKTMPRLNARRPLGLMVAHHPPLLQRVLHVLQEMRADDALDLLHGASLEAPYSRPLDAPRPPPAS